MSIKLTWKVADAPTGRYRSFEHRSWPTAWYGKPEAEGSRPAAWLRCEDDYTPGRARGEHPHGPIKISIPHHQHPDCKKRGSPWVVFNLTNTASTLVEAKERVQAFLDAHPDWHPKELK
jgi:hypothetical protein